ncbi:type I-G CRISPR-associated helicase/endonuclease Cas3g [Thermithiobacillus plumbiphilus]|uniref:CRISPR-associated helicase Cas3 n=1 Tax=Thermithiobacillus plumbiphilus TaxID=1729899 RepID=A0ABU9DBW8_9PROT
MEYEALFRKATGLQAPYPYQVKLAKEPWPDTLDIPTGLGKTAAVMLAWYYKRRVQKDAATPRRLVICLPMRVLVEQTHSNINQWLENLGDWASAAGNDKVSVHLLMGGENDLTSWADFPEEDMILIGTQDMLLSRALMRGYGMSRYQWPVHFALLHNDALWAFDEVQLMGAGLQTSAQLESFRRSFILGSNSRSLWVSATLNKNWLATVDFKPYLENLAQLTLSPDECANNVIQARREAVKRLSRAQTALTTENTKAKAIVYAQALTQEVLEKHLAGTQSIVIINTVERAQAIFGALKKHSPNAELLLIHSRFRPPERKALNQALSIPPSTEGPGRIVVATQAIEAGVDMTSRVLFTELAPWSSLVQRFGRCNRYGECNDSGGADVFWIDQDSELTNPYAADALALARDKLMWLDSASPAHLPATDEPSPLVSVLRRRDFLELFNTDPDLSGFDTDISIYIRDADDLDVQVFWRDLIQGVEEQTQPSRNEICRASLSQLKNYLDKRKGEDAAWRWDALDGKWKLFREKVRPGLILMLNADLGGYDAELGFSPEKIKYAVTILPDDSREQVEESYDGDARSQQNHPVELALHLNDVEQEMRNLAHALELSPKDAEATARAGRWHDTGKAHEVFRSTMTACESMAAQKNTLWAKSPCRGRHKRPHFRHELASMLAWLTHRASEPNADLIAYLIAAHHGKVRMSLRALPDEKSPETGTRLFARGVWDGDTLPGIDLPTEHIPDTTLRLDIMQLGESAMGSSWSDRVQRLLAAQGPFRLAWLEALVRIADWRASRKEQEDRA